MAPQQNSTLIDSNLDACPSLINLPEELQRYSPILPPKHQQQQQQQQQQQHENRQQKPKQKQNQDNNNNNNDHFDNKITATEEFRNVQSRELGHEAHFNECQVAALGRNKQQKKHCKSGCYRTAVVEGGARRSRSISLYGINSTVEQGNKEIPIWLDNEPRYVSGVTNKTTCNDIIKALIDDEIRNSNEMLVERDGGVVVTAAATASRDYSDYVITESWRGIERSYDGNMAILPVWRAWTRVHNELRLAMKHYKEINDPLPLPDQIQSSNRARNTKKSCAILQYLKKLFHFGKHNNDNKNIIKNMKTKEKCLLKDKKHPIPDEFFFVILPEQIYEKETDADGKSYHKSHNKNLKKITSHQSEEVHNLFEKKLYKLAESKRATQGKRAKRRQPNELQRCPVQVPTTAAASSCIRRRRKDGHIRDSIRHRLAKRYAEINTLYDREYELTKQLTKKCKLYKLQNALYTNPPTMQMDLSVGQIQRNIEQCAEEIVQTEHELLELKNEIKQDISLINNLKRMAIQDNTPTMVTKCNAPPATTELLATTYDKSIEQGSMQFVDNIYEFCDNNASMLV